MTRTLLFLTRLGNFGEKMMIGKAEGFRFVILLDVYPNPAIGLYPLKACVKPMSAKPIFYTDTDINRHETLIVKCQT